MTSSSSKDMSETPSGRRPLTIPIERETNDIISLSKLLKTGSNYQNEQTIIDDKDKKVGIQNLTPASIGPLESSKKSNSKKSKKKKEDLYGDIWPKTEDKNSSSEIDGESLNLISDPRKEPEFEFLYRQRLASEHVFLPISVGQNKCSEDLVIKIKLPNDNLRDVTLEVTASLLRLASPIHRLHLYLPVKVDERQGVASWDPIDMILSVTIPTEKNIKK